MLIINMNTLTPWVNTLLFWNNVDLPFRTMLTIELLALLRITQRPGLTRHWARQHALLLARLQILEELQRSVDVIEQSGAWVQRRARDHLHNPWNN